MPAKRLLPNIHTEKLEHARMWREDIEEMAKIITQTTVNGEVSIRADDYELDEIGDLAQIPANEVTSITISGKTPNLIELKLQLNNSTISAVEPSLGTRGALTEILKVNKRCRRSLPIRLMDSGKFWLALTLFGVLLSWASRTLNGKLGNQNPPVFSLGLFVSTGIMAAVLFVVFRTFRVGRSTFYTRTRTEAPTFWMRKRDDLTITIASNVVSLALGGVIGYWINTLG